MTKTPLELLTAFAQDVLNPEMYGYAVTAEVRDAARKALGREPVEIENFKEVTVARNAMRNIATKVMEHVNAGFTVAVDLDWDRSVYTDEVPPPLPRLKSYTIRLEERRWNKPEWGDKDFMPKIDGKSFRCECGCNIFRKSNIVVGKYKCNACGATYKRE